MSSEIGPYTPIPHSLAQEVGLVCAAVYGVVWRKCQMEEGVCRASLDKLGSDINVDRATVMRSIKKLCELGYLIDQTPGRRNAPHTYTLSKSVAECNSKSVVMRNSQKGSVADGNKSVAYNNSFIEDDEQEGKTVAESHLKIEESLNPESSPKKESERESHAHKLKRIGEVDFLAQNRPFAVKLSEICGNPGPEYVTNGDRRKLAEAAAQLLDWDATIDQLTEFRQKWKFDDDPWLSQVVGQWGRYLTAKKRPQKASQNGFHGNKATKRTNPPLPPATEAEQQRLLRMEAARIAPDDS